MQIVDVAASAPWAILPEHLERILAIAAREHTPEALEAYRAQRADRGERLGIRDGVGILNVSGPLFKRANLFVQISGATSYDILRRDLQAALDNPAITAILLNIDSPGGEASGCDELACAIYEARNKKPITAYVSGYACSGAYWIAAAASRIVVSDLATLGSIGVVLAVESRKKADERAGISRMEFVSSQSPGKRPDVETDDGKRRVQKMVDDLGAVFVSAIAKYRGVSVQTVLTKFGGGGVEVGKNAVAAGMADELGQFESALAGIRSKRITSSGSGLSLPRSYANAPAVEAAAREAMLAERSRATRILGHAGAAQLPGLASMLVSNQMGEENAVKILAAAADDLEATRSGSAGWARALALVNQRVTG